jgi:hypothetical protein
MAGAAMAAFSLTSPRMADGAGAETGAETGAAAWGAYGFSRGALTPRLAGAGAGSADQPRDQLVTPPGGAATCVGRSWGAARTRKGSRNHGARGSGSSPTGLVPFVTREVQTHLHVAHAVIHLVADIAGGEVAHAHFG